MGTPEIGSDGDKIYVSHNVPNATSLEAPYRGQVTIVSDNGGNVVLAAEISDPTRSGPYSPLSLQTATIDGQDRDMVVFGESWGDGYVEDGRVFVIAPSDTFDANNGIGQDSYTLNSFGDWNFATVTKPVLNNDLTALYVGGLGSRLAAWLGTNPADLASSTLQSPTWSRSVQPTERNRTQRECRIESYRIVSCCFVTIRAHLFSRINVLVSWLAEIPSCSLTPFILVVVVCYAVPCLRRCSTFNLCGVVR